MLFTNGFRVHAPEKVAEGALRFGLGWLLSVARTGQTGYFGGAEVGTHWTV